MILRKAERKKAKIRLGLSAVSGGGKTYSSILIAKGLVGDLSKVVIIDTENGSADLYAHLGDYNVLPLSAPFEPERYIEAIKACEKAGMEVIIIDSIAHEWEGKGGCLEIVDKLGGKYQDWAKVTPRHNAFVQAMLQSPAHIITTVRRKQDYEMTKDSNGRLKVEKAGLKEVTRDGWEYELTVNLQLSQNNYATASKDRTGLFTGKPEFIPTVETGILIRDWCESGAEPAPQEPIWTYTLQMHTELENLLRSSTYQSGSKEYTAIESNINASKEMTPDKFAKIKTNLLANQQNPTTELGNPSARQLNKEINRRIENGNVKEAIDGAMEEAGLK